METRTPITKAILLKYGFKREVVRNLNDESDSKMLVLYRKGDIAVGYDYGWGVYEMGFDKTTFAFPIETWEDLVNGMNNIGLAMIMAKQ